jgi:hypothetical protein
MPGPDAAASATGETASLAPWMRAYAAFYGRAPELREGADGRRSIRIAAEEDSLDIFRRMVGTIGHFARKPAILQHLRELGYEWNGAGVILTVPTPATFRATMASMDASACGFTPQVTIIDAFDIPAGAWLLDLTRGLVTINVGSAALYRRRSPPHRAALGEPRHRSRLGTWLHHLLCLPHDMSKHVLPLHLVPRPAILDLGARVREALGPWRTRVASLGLKWPGALGHVPKRWQGPGPLLRFYENDLVDYCHRVWGAVDRPADFAPVFTRPKHYRQLTNALERRIEQVRVAGGKE